MNMGELIKKLRAPTIQDCGGVEVRTFSQNELDAADAIEQLVCDAVKMTAALEFYADVSKYPAPLTGGMGALWSDCGEFARDALTNDTAALLLSVVLSDDK